jgi:zinc protease
MTRVLQIRTVAALACAFFLSSPAAAQVARPDELRFPPLPDFNVPKPARFVLPNGMVVMVMEDHELPLVNVVARIRTAALLEPADKTGLASITGQLLRTGGTSRTKPDALDEFLESKAASIETSIGADSGSASMSALKADVSEVLAHFADVLRRPAFDPARLAVAITGANASIARQNDTPSSILSREFTKVIYGQDAPYARTPTYASIAAITRDDLVAWHARDFHPDRIILGVVGDISVNEARQLVTRAFGDWPAGSQRADPLPQPRAEPSPGVFEAVKADSTQTFVSVGHQGSLLRTHPDFFAAELFNEVLSGNFTSRLFSAIRTEKGLAYSVSGGIGAGWIRVNPFTMSMSTKVETTAAAIDALIAEARALITTRPPTDEEVELARSSILNSFVFNSDSPAEVLGQQMTFEYYGQPLDWLDRYRSAIEKVTTSEVAAAGRKYVDPDKLSIVVVGPEEGRDKPLSTLGPVTRLDISIPEPPDTSPKPSVTPQSTEKGRALIEKAVEGFGGAATLDGLKSYREQGLMVVKAPQGEIEVQSTVTIVLPDRVRQEMVTPVGTMTFVITPADAFMQTPQGVQPVPAPLREQGERSLRVSPLVLLRQRAASGFSAAALGGASIDDTAVERVRVEIGNDVVTLAIDPGTGRILSSSYRGAGPGGAPGEIVERYADFRTVNGLSLPFKTTRTFNGEPAGGSTLSVVQLNPDVDPAAFARPPSP